MPTAAAYIRVSDRRQDEYSPESQLKLIRDYAARTGYVLPEEYIFYDDGISAKSANKRDQFKEMIALAKEKVPPFTAILVWKFSRFARNQEESIVYKSMLRRNGVSVISVSEPIPEDAFGSLIERIIEWMDEYYLIRLAPEVRRGMKEKASRGESMAPASFGYTFNKLTKLYEPDPATAPALQQIFARYAAGQGLKQIAVWLNDEGYRTVRGRPFDNRGVEYILNNPVYIGKIRWSADGKKASLRDYAYTPDQISDGRHQPLIDSDLWDTVQHRLKEEKAKYGPYQRPEQPVEWRLKGLVRCSNCGGTLVHATTKCPSMQCHNYARGSCAVSHSLSIAKANRLVTEAIRDLVNNDALPLSPEPLTSIPAAPDYARRLSAIDQKLNRLSDAYLSGVYTLQQFSRLKSSLDAESAAIKKEQAAAAALAPADPAAYRNRLRTVLSILEDSTASEQSKSTALRSILTSITYNKSTSTLDLHFYS